jgi:hypothetical protein
MPPPAPKKETRNTFKPSDMQMIATEIESLNENIKDLNQALINKTEELKRLNAIENKTKWNERDIEDINPLGTKTSGIRQFCRIPAYIILN